jgi:MFS family permease
MAGGSWSRARAALASRDFRFLLASRLTSQLADGLFQAYLVAQLVFLNPEKSGTALGVAKAYAVLVIPFSIVGPLSGVFIDRWPRRAILSITPLVRTLAILALLPVGGSSLYLYAPALIVVSLNRFYLATAGAVTPALVSGDNLLVGNSMATVGGTVATFVGVVAGTKLVDPIGTRGLVLITAVAYPLAALLARRISIPLRPVKPRAALSEALSRVGRELVSGVRRLVATPVAFGSIVSISLDQFLIGVVTVLSVVVFKEQFRESVGSFGNIVAAGGVGVLVGTLTAGWIESKLSKPRIVAVSFAIAGATACAVAPAITGPTILFVSFALGLTFAWRKVSVDTLVQEAIPDRYRGRVFAAYDLTYSMARVFAALVAVVLTPRVSTGWILGIVGIVYLAWAPVVTWWLSRPRWVRVRFYAGARADEVPRAIEVAGEESPVEVLGSFAEETGGERRRRFRLEDDDGTLLEISGTGGPRWRVDREIPASPSHG